MTCLSWLENYHYDDQDDHILPANIQISIQTIIYQWSWAHTLHTLHDDDYIAHMMIRTPWLLVMLIRVMFPHDDFNLRDGKAWWHQTSVMFQFQANNKICKNVLEQWSLPEAVTVGQLLCKLLLCQISIATRFTWSTWDIWHKHTIPKYLTLLYHDF